MVLDIVSEKVDDGDDDDDDNAMKKRHCDEKEKKRKKGTQCKSLPKWRTAQTSFKQRFR